MPGGMVCAICQVAWCMLHVVWQVAWCVAGTVECCTRQRTAHLDGNARAQPALQLGRCDIPARPQRPLRHCGRVQNPSHPRSHPYPPRPETAAAESSMPYQLAVECHARTCTATQPHRPARAVHARVHAPWSACDAAAHTAQHSSARTRCRRCPAWRSAAAAAQGRPTAPCSAAWQAIG
jgi:hypothetical protein